MEIFTAQIASSDVARGFALPALPQDLIERRLQVSSVRVEPSGCDLRWWPAESQPHAGRGFRIAEASAREFVGETAQLARFAFEGDGVVLITFNWDGATKLPENFWKEPEPLTLEEFTAPIKRALKGASGIKPTLPPQEIVANAAFGETIPNPPPSAPVDTDDFVRGQVEHSQHQAAGRHAAVVAAVAASWAKK